MEIEQEIESVRVGIKAVRFSNEAAVSHRIVLHYIFDSTLVAKG